MRFGSAEFKPRNRFEKGAKSQAKKDDALHAEYEKLRRLIIDPVKEEEDRAEQAGETIVPPEPVDEAD